MTTRTVGSGKDDPDINTAVTWFEDTLNHDFSSDGIGTISCETNDEDTVSVGIAVNNTSSSAYLKITVAAENRHSGHAGTGHYRLKTNPGTGHVIQIDGSAEYTMIEYLDIEQGGTGSSSECIRCKSTGCLFSRLVVHDGEGEDNQDGIFFDGSYAGTATNYIDNCHIYNFKRCCVNHQAQNTNTLYTYIDWCTMHDACKLASPGTVGGNVVIRPWGVSNSFTVEAHNNINYDSNGNNRCWYQAGSGTKTWNGDYNTSSPTSDGSATTYFDSGGTNNWSVTTQDTSPSSGDNVWLTSRDPTFDVQIGGTNDFTVTQDANFSEATRDTRQNWALDIAGNTRSAANAQLGCFAFGAAGAGQPTMRRWGGVPGMTPGPQGGHRSW